MLSACMTFISLLRIYIINDEVRSFWSYLRSSSGDSSVSKLFLQFDTCAFKLSESKVFILQNLAQDAIMTRAEITQE